MTEPAKYDPKITPAVMLAGKLWPIPKLAPRQMRFIYEQLIRVTDALSKASGKEFGDRAIQLTNQHFDDASDVVFHGLSRAHPELEREEFMDMEISPVEMLSGFLVVRAQTGMFKAVEAGAVREGGTKGEAKRVALPGTPSSRGHAATSTAHRTTGKTRSPGTGSKRRTKN